MISIEKAIEIHAIVVEKFGGANGLRDKNLLNSALSRPFQTFDNVDLYDTPAKKAAAIIESVLINHPFLDGNKRTGYVLYRLILNMFDCDINASFDEKYEFVISITTGQRRFDEILKWTEFHLISLP